MSGDACALCGGVSFVRTFEPVIVDCAREVFRAELRTHPTVLRHGRRVIAAGTLICGGCAEVISYLPAVDTGAA